jgi:hypothetical protein
MRPPSSRPTVYREGACPKRREGHPIRYAGDDPTNMTTDVAAGAGTTASVAILVVTAIAGSSLTM